MVFYSNDYSKDFLRKITLIEEEILLEEEIIFESLLIHENIVEKAITGTVTGIYKSLEKYFEAFITAVKGIYRKFIDNVTRLFKTSQKWLEQNKSYIFNADLKGFKYEIFPYWISSEYAKRIDKGLPPLNDNTINLIMQNDSNKEYFVQECLKKVGLGNRNIRTGNGFEDDLKTVLRGNYSKKIIGSELTTKISDIYDYCYDYKNEHKKVKELVNTIINGSNQALKKLKEAERNVGVDPNKSKENISESSLLESLILLEEINNNKPKQILNNNHPTKGAAEIAKAKNSATNVTELNKRNNENLQNDSKTQKEEEKNEYKGKSKSEIQKLLSAYKVFLEVEQKFLSIRITIMEEKFKVYMSLLRTIVQKSMGQSDKQKQTGKSASNQEGSGRLF